MVRPALLRLLESYFRHRWLYLLPIFVMLSLGILYVLTKPPIYISAGTLRIQKESLLASLTDLRNEGYSYFTPAEETVDELNELLRSDAFIRAIVSKTDLEGQMNDGNEAVQRTIDEVRRAIWVQTLGNNLVLIGSSHEDPSVAFQLIRSAMDTYVGSKINASLEESKAAQTFFTEIISSYRSELAPASQALVNYLTDHPEPIRGDRPAVEEAEIARLRADVDDAQERLRNAQINEENARLAQAQTESDVRQTYFELDSPRLPTEPSQSLRDKAIALIVFGAIGAFLSLIGIVGGALLDQTLRFPIDVRQSLHLPVLGMVPATEGAAAGPFAPPLDDPSQIAPLTRYDRTPRPTQRPPAVPTAPAPAVGAFKAKTPFADAPNAPDAPTHQEANGRGVNKFKPQGRGQQNDVKSSNAWQNKGGDSSANGSTHANGHNGSGPNDRGNSFFQRLRS